MGGVQVEIGGVWNIFEKPHVFKVHGSRQWKCFGIFYLKYALINIIAWKCNRGFEKSFRSFERGHENLLLIRGGSWNFYHHRTFQTDSPTVFVMSQSHCAESTAKWGRIDHSSLYGWSFLVIPCHSSNDNDNDNRIQQCSSHPCSLGRLVRTFWTCSKSLSSQRE